MIRQRLIFRSPKGLHKTAQGKALGAGSDVSSEPCKGAIGLGPIAPLQGFSFKRLPSPGRRFALPWADLLQPFGLRRRNRRNLYRRVDHAESSASFGGLPCAARPPNREGGHGVPPLSGGGTTPSSHPSALRSLSCWQVLRERKPQPHGRPSGEDKPPAAAHIPNTVLSIYNYYTHEWCLVTIIIYNILHTPLGFWRQQIAVGGAGGHGVRCPGTAFGFAASTRPE